MPVLSLPLTFNNSFWTQDYRKGLEIVHAKLVQGVEEDSQIIAFIRARAAHERTLAASLRNPALTGPPGTGFDKDDGASLLVAFRGLQTESARHGEVHRAIAHELDTIVADPFSDWAEKHSLRVDDGKRTLLDGWLKQYEEDSYEVDKLKKLYLAKRQRADELEDDAKFAPNSSPRGSYTLSPPQRSVSLSDRFGQRPRPSLPSTARTEPAEILRTPNSEAELSEAETVKPDSAIKKLDKGKGKETDPPPALRSVPVPSVVIPSTPPKLESVVPSEPVVLLAGLAFSGAALPNLLKRAKAELPLRPVRFPILGEYEDTFTGEDFTTWLKNNVPGFDGSLDRAETAARELTERDKLIKKIGEIGNKFENHPAALYQFRPQAFEPPTFAHADSGKSGSIQEYLSPVSLTPVVGFAPKRSNTFKSFLDTFNGPAVEPAHVKARAEAQVVNERYRRAVRALDRQRTALEDQIERGLKLWNRWELDRLRSVKTVLLQYQGTLANLASAYGPSLERSSNLIESFQPEADLLVTIERYRTGPFRPVPQVYKSAETGQTDVVFGIDLRRWAGDEIWHSVRNGTSGPAAMGIPPVVKGLLQGLNASYAKLSNTERRKAWIYDVPLQSQHALREVLNGLPKDSPVPLSILEKYDTPILAGTLKLWLLELDPPLALWEGWDEIRKLYPSVGVDSAKDRHIAEELRQTLGHWPMVHLQVLDAVVSHLKELVDNTTNDTESTEVYLNKLALSIGRTIIRPKSENQYSIQDRHPTVFFIDLVNKYAETILPAIAHKKRDSGRSMPQRKRTALVDMRVHRSKLSADMDLQQIRDAHTDVQRSRNRTPSPAPGEPRGIRPLSLVGGTSPRSRASSLVAGERTPKLASVQPSDLPPRPQFKEPEPEPEEVVPSGASVIVVPPSPLHHVPPQLEAFSSASSSAPVAAAVVALPPALVPTEGAKATAGPAAPVLAPTPVPGDIGIKEPGPPPSIITATTSSRASSPTKVISDSPTTSSPGSVASPHPRRGSGSSLQRAGSMDGATGAGVRGPRAPRIIRGPRVANPSTVTSTPAVAGAGGRGLNSNASASASASIGSSLFSRSNNTSSRSLPDRTSPPRDTSSPNGSASGASKTMLKMARPKSAIHAGHLATRTMASDSEADVIG